VFLPYTHEALPTEPFPMDSCIQTERNIHTRLSDREMIRRR